MSGGLHALDTDYARAVEGGNFGDLGLELELILPVLVEI